MLANDALSKFHVGMLYVVTICQITLHLFRVLLCKFVLDINLKYDVGVKPLQRFKTTIKLYILILNLIQDFCLVVENRLSRFLKF